ncbi:MAG: lysophospholipid acyltransferase family protein [Pyrinomonadaceae bacterium]
MPEQKDNVFQFASLSEYSLKERIMIRFADLAFFSAIKTLGSLTRFEIRGTEHLEAVENAGKIPIYTFWHDRIFLATHFWRDRGIVVITSKSFDGEYIARCLQRFGCGAIRGSSSKGGARALVEMIKTMRRGHPMAFAVDGPRGPRYEAKLGPIILAKKTGNPILPFVIEPQKFWTVKSWDKMQIPKPFTRALTIIGEPIYVDSNADDAEVESKLTELQHSLDSLVKQGKEWSGRIN